MLIRGVRGEHGDTIVEVLIAIAVVSLVLVVAYTTSTRNISRLEDTQEHSEALQLAQTQLEYLHSADITSRNTAANSGCFDNTGKPMASGSGSCLVDASDTPVGNSSAQPQFLITLTGTSAGNGLITYSAKVTWAGIADEQDNVTLYYQQG
ncbi:MAG TPA: hypothetical protein VMB52_03235 [Verrucomicrobiae bacterium]|nr:hypothetical protein [Verrucomicrobiae bacterium]